MLPLRRDVITIMPCHAICLLVEYDEKSVMLLLMLTLFFAAICRFSVTVCALLITLLPATRHVLRLPLFDAAAACFIIDYDYCHRSFATRYATYAYYCLLILSPCFRWLSLRHAMLRLRRYTLVIDYCCR